MLFKRPPTWNRVENTIERSLNCATENLVHGELANHSDAMLHHEVLTGRKTRSFYTAEGGKLRPGMDDSETPNPPISETVLIQRASSASAIRS